MSLLLSLLACRLAAPTDTDSAPEVQDTAQDTGQPWTLDHVDLYDFEGDNHLLPVELLVLPRQRRAYSYSQALGNVAEVDLDSKTLLRVIPTSGAGSARLYDGGEASLYIAFDDETPLQSLDIESGLVREARVGVAELRGMLSLSTDKLAVAGVSKDGAMVLQIVDPTQAYAQLAFVTLSEMPQAILNLNSSELAVVLGSSETGSVEIRDRKTLALLRSCPAPFGASAAASTPSGDVVLAREGQIGLAPCAPQSDTGVAPETQLLELGQDNTQVISLPTGVLVLDRGSLDPWGTARRFDTQDGRLELVDSFATGSHSGRGGRDRVTGLVWVNSQNTTSAWAMDLETGLPRYKVPLGMHLESMAAGDRRGQVFVTGRLSAAVLSVDFLSGAVNSADLGFDAPVAPVVIGDQLWVLDQLQGVLHAFDTQDLKHSQELVLGWGESESLTISDTLLHPVSHSLFVSSGSKDEVIEIDPDTQELLQTFSLGDPLSDDSPGALELLAFGEGVLAVRTFDGRLSVLDPSGGVSHHTPLTGILPPANHMLLSALSLDEALLYVGPYAIQTTDWSVVPTGQQDWSSPLRPYEDGSWLGWRSKDSALVHVDAQGLLLSPQQTQLPRSADPEWLLTPWSGRLIATDNSGGELKVFFEE